MYVQVQRSTTLAHLQPSVPISCNIQNVRVAWGQLQGYSYMYIWEGQHLHMNSTSYDHYTFVEPLFLDVVVDTVV